MPVRHALLALLAQQPRYGYELHAAFEALVGGQQNWDLKPAQVYTTLLRLTEAGLVRLSESGEGAETDKRLFEITPEGQKELQNWLHSETALEPQRDAFYLKLMLALSIGEEVRPIVRVQRTALYRRLHQLTTQRQEADPRRELAKILLMDKAVMHLEADLRWLDMIEARLDEVCQQPLPQPELRRRGRPARGS